jgi:hypothetical protein
MSTHPVQTHRIEHKEELPTSVEKFREFIQKKKAHILNELESSDLENEKESQRIQEFHNATQHIIRFGNILKKIFNNDNGDIKIINMLKDDGIVVANMSSHEKELCKYYVHTDIDVYTYDCNMHALKK